MYLYLRISFNLAKVYLHIFYIGGRIRFAKKKEHAAIFSLNPHNRT